MNVGSRPFGKVPSELTTHLDFPCIYLSLIYI